LTVSTAAPDTFPAVAAKGAFVRTGSLRTLSVVLVMIASAQAAAVDAHAGAQLEQGVAHATDGDGALATGIGQGGLAHAVGLVDRLAEDAGEDAGGGGRGGEAVRRVRRGGGVGGVGHGGKLRFSARGVSRYGGGARRQHGAFDGASTSCAAAKPLHPPAVARAATSRKALALLAGLGSCEPRWGMKAVVLSAVPSGHASMGALASVLQAELARAGYGTVKTFDLTSTRLAFCQGEFDCWVKTPGQCRAHDTETEILQAIHDTDALVLFGPVTFGGHGHVLKLAIDRLIPLAEPFFTRRHALTHHSMRYERSGSLFSVGWQRVHSAPVAATFAELNDANAVNLVAPGCGSVVLDDAHAEAWAEAIRDMLEAPRTPGASITAREPLRQILVESAAPDASVAWPVLPGRAAILVGSAKIKGTSASEVMARALARRLEAASMPTELHFATEFVHEDAPVMRSAASIAACELFVLVTPLYVDSLPALATHALELVNGARAVMDVTHRKGRFVLLVNCGFPEPEQTRTALRIARHFAEHAGYAWAGGLPLGGGGVVHPERPLDEGTGPVKHLIRALDLASPPLANGAAVPEEALTAILESPMPDVVYRVAGDLGWRWKAHQSGLAQRDLHARPLDHT
jgi:multimeric flavodoxin WrbA